MSIVQLSHGSDSGDVWGVNSNNEIYHRKSYNSTWMNVPGLLKQVSIAADGTVRGVNKKSEIYRREYDNRSWMRIPGAPKQVSVASDSSIWGVTVWGVGTDNEIYCMNEDGSGWKSMSPYGPVTYAQVSAGSNTNIWARDTKDNIYYCNGSNSLKSIEVATSNPDLINGIARENGMTNPIDMGPDKTGEFCVKVYPNPGSSFLTIEVSNAPAGDIFCSLFNAYGHLVARQSISSGTIQLNVSYFPKGLYTVVI
ncbi:MAG: T9SS type A sorting domain-containing protein, partial [Gammaproteobacteria bacterium]|nr:T9SS type A sorting domain-containing protein [Gammaproteobacteria bacterium]